MGYTFTAGAVPQFYLNGVKKNISLDENVFHKTGDETATGLKTFTDGITVGGNGNDSMDIWGGDGVGINSTQEISFSSPLGYNFSGSGNVKLNGNSLSAQAITSNTHVNANSFTVKSKAGDPTTTEVPVGTFQVWVNTSTSTIKLWANIGGVLKSTQLL
ncbi:hypothetical protein D3C72_950780 [compost metagenome]